MSVEEQLCLLLDPDWDLITEQIEALDRYLHVQNLRRMEEEYLALVLEKGDCVGRRPNRESVAKWRLNS